MGRPTKAAQRAYMEEYRSRPSVAAENAWYSRTYTAALRQLARNHPAEFMRVLFEIREADPKPEAAEGASDAA
jgi:hypothetical protein